jgi:hypothetical protein
MSLAQSEREYSSTGVVGVPMSASGVADWALVRMGCAYGQMGILLG